MELKHVLKALNEALERAEVHLKYQTERAEKAHDLMEQLEKLTADYKKLENKYTELEKRYRELKQGTEDY